MKISRRSFLKTAAAIGASLAWVGPARGSRVHWHERRDLYPQGVASGDPDPHSVILWTRRPFAQGTRQLLTVEVAEDEAFRRVIAHAPAPVSSAADWTARVLVGGLKPARTYWYRFTDTDGNGSRVGRTITAPLPNDPRTVNFAFVSCQDVNEGKLNAYRRMIYEDERAPAAQQLDFVLHLGDFIYEVVEYPDEVKTRYDRTIYEVARIPDGHKVGNFHIPLTVDGYRAIYKGYLADPDLQDARARWPFVAMWDNHEFSWQGWQSIVEGGAVRAARPEHQGRGEPGLVGISAIALQEGQRTVARKLRSARGEKCPNRRVGRAMAWAMEPNNLAAINSLMGYRALIATANTWTSSSPISTAIGAPTRSAIRRRSSSATSSRECFRRLWCRFSTAAVRFNGGNPPAEVRFNGAHVPNSQRNAPPQTILGAEQKAWFKEQLRNSTATWKIWGNSQGALDSRADPQNLPAGLTKESWPKTTYAHAPHRRLRHSLHRARRDLRSRARREDHRLRHRFRRPPQLLGRLRDCGTAARQVRSRRLELRRRLAVQRRDHGSQRAQSIRRTIRCARCSSPTGRTARSPTGRTTCW